MIERPKGNNMSESDNNTLVAQILSSYLANNSVAPADLQSVIETVKTAFGASASIHTAASAAEEPKKWEPAVSVRKSVSPDAIVCLCCGEKFKSLKRHLFAEHGLSPDDYRAAFGLKDDYPIVAPNYAAQRSALAKKLGLGRKVTKPASVQTKMGGRKTAVKEAAQ